MYDGVRNYNFQYNTYNQITTQNVDFQQAENNLMNHFWFHRAPVSNYNKQILKRANTNRWDIQRAHYQAKKVLREKEDSDIIKNESLFKRKKLVLLNFICILWKESIGSF